MSDQRSVGSWREAARDAVVPFVVSRIVLAGVAVFANSYLLPITHHRRIESHGLSTLWGPWRRFDSLWYLHIAQHGYSASSGPEWAFYPVFPATVRVLAFPFGGGRTALLLVGLVVANVAAIAAAWVLYRLARAEWGRDVARRTALYFAFFPLSFYLSAPYAESMFVLLAVCCLALTRQHRWIAAGAVGALAAATRPPGVMLALVLFTELAYSAYLARKAGTKPDLVRPLLGTALVPVGLLAFMAYASFRTGDWLATFHVNSRTWGRHLAFPWTTIENGIDKLGWGNPMVYQFSLLNLTFVVIYLVAIALMAKRFPPTFTVFTATMAILSVTSNALQSVSRQSLPAVTLLILLATMTKSETSNRHQLILLGFSGVGCVFLICYVLRVPAIA